MKRRTVHSLLPLALPFALVVGSVAVAAPAGAATGTIHAVNARSTLLDRARVLRAVDDPLMSAARASRRAPSTEPGAGVTGLVAPHQSKAFLASLKTPTLVFTRLDAVGTSFGLQTKNLLTGAVGNLLALSGSICPIGPRLSPDTTKVVFVDYGANCTGNGTIEVLTVASSAISVLGTAAPLTYLTLPNWSPDGATVLYTLETDTAGGSFLSSALFTVPAAGGSPTAVGGSGVGGYDGVYSPDGTKIVFAPTSVGTESWLSVMNADGTGATVLTKTTNALGFSPVHPSWSPDGTKVSYTFVKFQGTNTSGPFFVNGLGVAAVDGSSGGDLMVTKSSQYNVFYSAWSADSTEIFYDALLRDTTSGANITNSAEYVTDAATGSRRATLVADGLNAYDGVAFAGDSPSTSSASTYFPVAPTRLLAQTLLGPGGYHDLQVTGGTSPVPAGASAVTFNLTGVSPTSNTYLQAYPTPVSGTAAPLVSNLNLVPGQVSAVAVQVSLSATGMVRIRNSSGNVGVIVDVSGYFTAGTLGNQYVPITPVRAMDTTLGGPGTVDVTVAGLGPANPGFTPVAVVLNLTGAGPTSSTYLSVYPTQAGTPPLVSNLNLAAHEVRANLVTVPLSVDGKVTVRNAFGSVRAVVDVVGFYGTGGTGGLAYYPLQPTRFMDTRVGTNTWVGSAAPLVPGANIPIQMRGTAATSAGIITVPATAQAYVYNLTVVASNGNTYLTAYPHGSTQPLASSINASPGTVVSNLAITGTDPNGLINLYNRVGNTPVLIDLAGYYAP